MERALVLRQHFFGIESPEVVHACKTLAEMCNLLSMSFLQQGTVPTHPLVSLSSDIRLCCAYAASVRTNHHDVVASVSAVRQLCRDD